MSLTQQQRFDILERDRFTCRFCGLQAPETQLEIDHVKPKSRGGTDDYSNLVTSCRDCNRGKGDRQVDLSPVVDWGELVGKYFHRNDPEDGYVNNQGRIVGRADGGLYLIQFFDWLVGAPNRITAIHSDDFADGTWSFYAEVDEMIEAHEYNIGVKSRPGFGRREVKHVQVPQDITDEMQRLEDLVNNA